MNRIVAFALRQQALMAALFIFVCAAGLVGFLRLNIEAIRIRFQMAGIPHVAAIRTISLFGPSDVKLRFTYDVTCD
jgi:heavy metal efflux system protein